MESYNVLREANGLNKFCFPFLNTLNGPTDFLSLFSWLRVLKLLLSLGLQAVRIVSLASLNLQQSFSVVLNVKCFKKKKKKKLMWKHSPILCDFTGANSGQRANTAVVCLGRTGLSSSWILTSCQQHRVTSGLWYNGECQFILLQQLRVVWWGGGGGRSPTLFLNFQLHRDLSHVTAKKAQGSDLTQFLYSSVGRDTQSSFPIKARKRQRCWAHGQARIEPRTSAAVSSSWGML